eukprot:5157443-Prymnesium_polylepis.1
MRSRRRRHARGGPVRVRPCVVCAGLGLSRRGTTTFCVCLPACCILLLAGQRGRCVFVTLIMPRAAQTSGRARAGSPPGWKQTSDCGGGTRLSSDSLLV